MADDRRRARTVVVALCVVVAAAVLLTLRCVTDRGADGTRHESVAGDADGAAHSAGEAPGPGATYDRPADGGDAAKSSKPSGTSRRRARLAIDAAPEAATSSEPPASKASAAARRASRDETYGRFTLVGEAGTHAGRRFGASVAIDRDVAVIGAPGFKHGDVACGAAYVYELKDGVWTETQRIDSPRPRTYWFAWRVGVSSGRIVVFGGDDAGACRVFRSYVRGKDGRWVEEATVDLADGTEWDAAFRGDTAVIPVLHAIDVWRLRTSGWTRTQRIEDSGSGRSRCQWVSLAGDTVAYARWDDLRNDQSASLFRLREGSYEPDATLATTLPMDRGWGTVARNGDALVRMGESVPYLAIDERRGVGWTRAVATLSGWDGFVALVGSHPIAADGDLVVAASRDWDEFRVLERREDGWYRTSMGPKPDASQRSRSGGMWPAWFANVAVSGRAVVIGTQWDSVDTGRAWFFDITDDDLARATKVESDAK